MIGEAPTEGYQRSVTLLLLLTEGVTEYRNRSVVGGTMMQYTE